MLKKLILPGLIVGLISILIVGKVFAATGKTTQYLEANEYVWAGSINVQETDLKPIALTGKLSNLMTQRDYALTLAIQETIDTLIKTKTASTSRTKQFFKEAINLPAKIELLEGNRVLIQTGGAGTAEFEAEKGRYAMQIAPVNSVNLNLPSSVNINLDEYVIPVGINDKGSGTVKKIASSFNSGLVNEVSAQAPAGNSKVKLAMFYDKNNNGKWDSDEPVAPWAGIRIDLVNLGKKSGINLSDEWKDLYLDGARQGLRASELVDDLSKNCPTAGVSYIDGDTRKTYLKREGEVFGSDDFDITSGKVYSVKGCEIPFYIIGYDLEKQFEKN